MLSTRKFKRNRQDDTSRSSMSSLESQQSQQSRNSRPHSRSTVPSGYSSRSSSRNNRPLIFNDAPAKGRVKRPATMRKEAWLAEQRRLFSSAITPRSDYLDSILMSISMPAKRKHLQCYYSETAKGALKQSAALKNNNLPPLKSTWHGDSMESPELNRKCGFHEYQPKKRECTPIKQRTKAKCETPEQIWQRNLIARVERNIEDAAQSKQQRRREEREEAKIHRTHQLKVRNEMARILRNISRNEWNACKTRRESQRRMKESQVRQQYAQRHNDQYSRRVWAAARKNLLEDKSKTQTQTPGEVVPTRTPRKDINVGEMRGRMNFWAQKRRAEQAKKPGQPSIEEFRELLNTF